MRTSTAPQTAAKYYRYAPTRAHTHIHFVVIILLPLLQIRLEAAFLQEVAEDKSVHVSEKASHCVDGDTTC